MTLGRLGVWYPTDRLNGQELGDFVKAVERNGYSALWYLSLIHISEPTRRS